MEAYKSLATFVSNKVHGVSFSNTTALLPRVIRTLPVTQMSLMLEMDLQWRCGGRSVAQATHCDCLTGVSYTCNYPGVLTDSGSVGRYRVIER